MSQEKLKEAMDKALSKSAVSLMWAEKSREQLELLRNRSLSDTDWLAVLIDGVWLTREICVVVAVGIDIGGNKQVLEFEQGPSENITVVTELIKRLAKRGMRENKLRRLLVLRDGRRRCSRSAWCMPNPTFATSCVDVTGRIWIYISRYCARRRNPKPVRRLSMHCSISLANATRRRLWFCVNARRAY
jgi:hypothetical protein